MTLALPPLLVELNMSINQLAAVIGLYAGGLALCLVAAEGLRRRLGDRNLAIAALGLFGIASLLCAFAQSPGTLLFGRALQAVGAAGSLVGCFALLRADRDPGARLWEGAAVIGFAAGPALGGLLTELLDWRAIFVTQAPIAFVAALTAWQSNDPAETPRPTRRAPDELTLGGIGRALARFAPALALGLVAAALTAVLFGLVLLLVAGWAESPLQAALAVSPLPLAAFPASKLGGDARLRACAGASLIAAAIASLAWLPEPNLIWPAAAAAVAGFGMGLALSALSNDLLSERTAADAARLMTIRHVGIVAALLALAPLITADLDEAIFDTREQGVALVLDAALPPDDKLDLAPQLLATVDQERPRAALRDAFAAAEADRTGEFSDQELAVLEELAARADDVLVAAIADGFRSAFLLTAAFAGLAALALLPSRRRILAVAVIAGGAAVLPLTYRHLEAKRGPETVTIADPCADRDLPDSGGLTGFAQQAGLLALDTAACRYGSSREELALALADQDSRRHFEDEHGFDPSSIGGIVEGLVFGDD